MGISVSKKIHLATDLSFYETACQHDSDLKSFDATIQSRMNQVIVAIAADVEDRPLSIDSLTGATKCLLEMNQDVAKLITDCKNDIWSDEELFKLVEEYFESSLMTLNFYNELKKCLKRAKDSQVNLLVAFQLFDEEKRLAGNNGYPKTLGALKKFKDTGDLFTEEFFKMFQSVYDRQDDMRKKLQKMTKMLQKKAYKKLKSINILRKVLNAMSVLADVFVLIYKFVASAFTSRKVAEAIASSTATRFESMRGWIESFLKNYENALKGQTEVAKSALAGTYATIKEMENIRVLIDRLEPDINSIRQYADMAIDQGAVNVVIDEIKKEFNPFKENVEDLISQADKFSSEIIRARNEVLQRMRMLPHS